LIADPARLASAAPALPAAERAALRREPGGWTAADVPLLDEAAELSRAGPAGRPGARTGAAGRLRPGRADITVGSRDLSGEVLSVADLLDVGELAARREAPDHQTMAGRAAANRTWRFGHVIVDEAQKL
jgi:hypothetical protein